MTVMMDGDLEDPPELIPAMVAKEREGWEVVYAVKRTRRDALPRRIAFRAFHAPSAGSRRSTCRRVRGTSRS
jgi:hypothetical protein